MKEREREREILREILIHNTHVYIIPASCPFVSEFSQILIFKTDKRRIKNKFIPLSATNSLLLYRRTTHPKCVGRFSRRKRNFFPRIPPPEEVFEEEEKEGECALRSFEEEEEEEEEQAPFSQSFPRWERQKKRMKKRKTFLCRRRLIFFSRRRRRQRR